jgi:hypothetical protein
VQSRLVMNSTTKQVPNATISVGQVASRNGYPEPQIEVRVPKGTHHRTLKAALYRLAADVEVATAATPAKEAWIVQVDATSDERGRIYLELMDATEQEAKRALALLRSVVG